VPEKIRSDIGVTRQYLALRPSGLIDAVRLYRCYVRAALQRALRPDHFSGVGYYLSGPAPVTVRSNSLTLRARPRTEDLLYLLPAHKAAVSRWFTPESGELVADVGAHIGFFSLRAGRSGARVLAIEPNPATASILAQNIELNGFDNVTIVSTAAGDAQRDGTLEVPFVQDGKSSLTPGWASGKQGIPIYSVTVKVTTLDELIEHSGFDHLDWLLIDVEGFELAALRGATKTLPRTRRVIIEVARGPDLLECRRILEQDFGFTIREEERQTEFTDVWLAERECNPAGADFRLRP
jgi:FkbM family methyltransferase